MRSLEHPSKENITLSRVLYALSDPVRLSIVRRIAREGGERPCGDFDLCVAKSTASHHFRVLRNAGIIRMRSEGTQCLNSLRKDDLESLFPGLLDSVLNASGPD
jgi:DNA-binding transcriptional ArsR family regulator